MCGTVSLSHAFLHLELGATASVVSHFFLQECHCQGLSSRPKCYIPAKRPRTTQGGFPVLVVPWWRNISQSFSISEDKRSVSGDSFSAEQGYIRHFTEHLSNGGGFRLVLSPDCSTVAFYPHQLISPGLWAGLSPALAAAIPNTAIYFTMYDELTLKLRENHMRRFSASEDQARRQVYIPLFAASAARFVSSVATAPLELIKIRQANSIGNERTFIEEMRLVAREKGPAGLFRGVGSTILRDVPFSAVLFLTIETIKTSLHDTNALGARGARFYEDRGLQVPAREQLTEALVSAFGGGVVAVLATT